MTKTDRLRYELLLLVRLSSPKQYQEGESTDYQIARGLALAEERFGLDTGQVYIFTEIHTARYEDRPKLDAALKVIDEHQIPYCVFLDIDRFTRAGPAYYEQTKRAFKEHGCQIVDVKGIIQPEQNNLVGSGGKFGDDFDYDWGTFAPSEKAEIMEAQAAKDEARKILGRTIPIQISNVQQGRTSRPAPYGYAELEKQLLEHQDNRNNQEYSEQDIKRVIKFARHFVQNPVELIIEGNDQALRAKFWALIFTKTPTLEELRSRTAELSPLVRHRRDLDQSQFSLVSPNELRSNILYDELLRWASIILPQIDEIEAIIARNPLPEQETLPQAA